jgi:hypothetical protein
MGDLKAHPPGRIKVWEYVALRVDDSTGIIPGDKVGAMGDSGDEELMDDNYSHLSSDEQLMSIVAMHMKRTVVIPPAQKQDELESFLLL